MSLEKTSEAQYPKGTEYQMFERFTERARQVVLIAQQAARDLGCDEIGSEHLLVGLCQEEEGLAARVLESMDITAERVLRDLKKADHATVGQLPFTANCKSVLELALREALSLGHNYIGTEHILLGLMRRADTGAELVASYGADSDRVRNEVIRLLSGSGSRRKSEFPFQADAVLRLRPGHAVKLRDLVGARPHDEQWSKAVYEQIVEALKGRVVE